MPPRKDPIPNQDINMLGTVKHQIIPPKLPKFCPGQKSLRNEADNDHKDSTDTSRTDKEDPVDNLKSTNNKIAMTNTKREIIKINTAIKVL